MAYWSPMPLFIGPPPTSDGFAMRLTGLLEIEKLLIPVGLLADLKPLTWWELPLLEL